VTRPEPPLHPRSTPTNGKTPDLPFHDGGPHSHRRCSSNGAFMDGPHRGSAFPVLLLNKDSDMAAQCGWPGALPPACGVVYYDPGGHPEIIGTRWIPCYRPSRQLQTKARMYFSGKVLAHAAISDPSFSDIGLSFCTTLRDVQQVRTSRS